MPATSPPACCKAPATRQDVPFWPIYQRKPEKWRNPGLNSGNGQRVLKPAMETAAISLPQLLIFAPGYHVRGEPAANTMAY
jgi:hypothetical protein